MLNYCTLFDSNYLSRGIALYQSLKRSSPDFQLYVIAFNEDCYQFLKTGNMENLTVISLTEFEDEKLLHIKQSRTPAEYCWTCTPSIILYCIEKFNLSSCIYVDADMIFYDNPQILLDESPGCSVLITEHRYTKDYDVSLTHGKYCVQFMYFRNNESVLTALRWWRDRCLEWCYAYLEDGKFGDQKYLDDWTTRFNDVHVLNHPGGGMAPWNAQQFSFEMTKDKLFIRDKKSGNKYSLVFFHFHGLKFYSDEMLSLCDALYALNPDLKEMVYFPYIRNLLHIGMQIQQQSIKFDPHGASQVPPSLLNRVVKYGKDVLFLMRKGKISPFSTGLFNVSLHNHLYNRKQFK